MNYKIITVDESNIDEYGLGCLKNPEHDGYLPKLEWAMSQFKNGLIMKQLRNEKNKVAGFLEYIDGEHCWRSVDAKGYLFIHCLWILNSKISGKGFGTMMIKDCIEDAKKKSKLGVALLTSDGPWMVGKKIFEKNGFTVVDTKDRYELLVLQLKKGKLPKFIEWEKEQEKLKGLNLVYADQCPMIAKSVPELETVAKFNDVNLQVKKIENSEEAKTSPSGYGVYGMLQNGELIADHYISKTRFKNILKERGL
ncbi:MAG: hypothetical protein PVH88_27035 [Ignavibacteria bacterium]|jgi:hypothetical protein